MHAFDQALEYLGEGPNAGAFPVPPLLINGKPTKGAWPMELSETDKREVFNALTIPDEVHAERASATYTLPE
jgi:hypothetical protein